MVEDAGVNHFKRIDDKLIQSMIFLLVDEKMVKDKNQILNDEVKEFKGDLE